MQIYNPWNPHARGNKYWAALGGTCLLSSLVFRSKLLALSALGVILGRAYQTHHHPDRFWAFREVHKAGQIDMLLCTLYHLPCARECFSHAATYDFSRSWLQPTKGKGHTPIEEELDALPPGLRALITDYSPKEAAWKLFCAQERCTGDERMEIAFLACKLFSVDLTLKYEGDLQQMADQVEAGHEMAFGTLFCLREAYLSLDELGRERWKERCEFFSEQMRPMVELIRRDQRYRKLLSFTSL